MAPADRNLKLWLPLISNWALAMGIQQVNEVLAYQNVWLILEGLFLAFAVLYLRMRDGLIIAGVLGLLLDAGSFHDFGLRAVLYSAIVVAMQPLRTRVRRENPIHAIAIVTVMNLVIFAGLTGAAVLGAADLSRPLVWRCIVDLLLSEIVVAAAVGWWIGFQRQFILAATGEDPANTPTVRVW